MFPLHSGRIAGLPGRILISLCGLAIALLSVTGVLIWARKHRARRLQALKQQPLPGRATAEQQLLHELRKL